MSLWTMPIIVLNMGGEMVYILHQRLQAQTVQDDKAKKVLQDVVRAMFSPLFITELFKPQEMYSTSSTKQIFEKLAHSSIMRLNKSSMEKLYDLMTMGFKYQIVSCASPSQFLHVTLNHLESIKRIIRTSSESGATGGVDDLVDVAIEKLISTYAALSKGQWHQMHLTIMKFLQGKRIKVSLFLQQGMQGLDGVLVLNNGGALPYGGEKPGTLRYFDHGKCVNTRTVPIGASDPATDSNEDTSKLCVPAVTLFDMESTLGLNLFSKDSVAQAKAADKGTMNKALEELMATLTSSYCGSRGRSTAGRSRTDYSAGAKSGSACLGGIANTGSGAKITSAAAKAELTMLSDLLGMGGAGGKEVADSKPFKINLFPDNNFDNADMKADSKSGGGGVIMIDIDGSAGMKTLNAYMTELGLKDTPADSKTGAGAKPGAEEEEDDLLAMMDAASEK